MLSTPEYVPTPPRVRSSRRALAAVVVGLGGTCLGQPIDFESLPDGSPTQDQQLISTEYQASHGVRFALLHRSTGQEIGSPRIAKSGPPQTAFQGCQGEDTPKPGQGLGDTFLTDGNSLGIQGDLLVSYLAPVSSASGVILDLDCRTDGGPPCEQWTITARDANGNTIDTITIDALQGPSDPECDSNDGGPGDGVAYAFVFSHPVADIHSIKLRYTGDATDVGLAFDNFSPAGEPAQLDLAASANPSRVCAGEPVTLTASASGGVPPYSFLWEREVSPGVWQTVSNAAEHTTYPYADAWYRVQVTDQLETIHADPILILSDRVVYAVSQESAPGAADYDLHPVGEIQAYLTGGTASAYYGYSTDNPYFNAPAPALTRDRSHLFLLAATDGVSLVGVQDALTTNDGGRSETRIDLAGTTAGFLVKDDTTNDRHDVLDSGARLQMLHSWTSPNTDGYAAGPLGADWTADIQFADVFTGSPTIGGLVTWHAYSSDESSAALALEVGRRVRIESVCCIRECPPDLDQNCVLNIFDFLEFQTLFGNGNPRADLAAPFGVLNIFDFLGFQTLYGQGC